MRKLLITRAFSLGCLASSSSLIKVYTQELNGVGAENDIFLSVSCLTLQNGDLPRQARDDHEETSKNTSGFPSGSVLQVVC